jgi:hypothetical protein
VDMICEAVCKYEGHVTVLRESRAAFGSVLQVERDVTLSRMATIWRRSAGLTM